MKRLSPDAAPPFGFWDYFESIPSSDFAGHDCSEGVVEYAWEDQSGRFQHVLVNSDNKNVFMVLILDIQQRNIFGHRLLDLNKEYGLQPSAA